jgi:hypothetical protein
VIAMTATPTASLAIAVLRRNFPPGNPSVDFSIFASVESK